MLTIDLKKLRLSSGSRILDIGCGSGRHTGALAGIPGVSVIGADINPEDLRQAAVRLKLHEELGEVAGRWSLLAAHITALPFADDFFDLVVCSEVLEHIHDHESAVAELVRILKPGGQMAVSVPRYWPEKICWLLSREYRCSENGHIRIYSRKELGALLAETGLREWSSHFAHSIHTPYWWLKCLVGPSRTDSLPVNLYQRFLTWEILKKPCLPGFVDRLLNPLLGKSIVVYLTKDSR